VIQNSTGAWFDPDHSAGLCRQGTRNLLSLDKGTSRLAQGPIAHSCLVEVEPVEGEGI
jgi:biotin/methionine sulfoxide reductase